MNKLFLFYILLIVFSLNSCSRSSEEFSSNKPITIFYFPFALETFHPITITNIEAGARCRFLLAANDENATQLFELLKNRTDGSIRNKFIRVKISEPGVGETYVDRFGGILIGYDQQGQLTHDALDRLKILMERLSIQHSCETE